MTKLYISRDNYCIGSSKSDQGRKGRRESNCLVEKRAGSLPKSPNLFQQKNPCFCYSKFLTSSSAKSFFYFLKIKYFIFSKHPSIPDICQFWHTTKLLRPEKVHQKVRKFAKIWDPQLVTKNEHFLKLCLEGQLDGTPNPSWAP